MYANYHTHTWRCRHAVGTEREYIEQAIEHGIRYLGFSDHTPQIYEGGFYPDHEKMHPTELDGYVSTILALKEEYAADITIHLGLEVEYYPSHYDELMQLLGQYPFEYMILGQHYLRTGMPDDVFCFRPTEDPAVLAEYVGRCITALETGRFLYLAHPDVLYFTGDEEVYSSQIHILCTRAREMDIPLEINLYGLGDGRHYPDERFWKIAGECGCKAVLGSDAHSADRVCPSQTAARAEELAARYGLPLLGDLEDRF